MNWTGSLLMVGCGNMGGAMLTGWLAAGLDPAAVTVVDPVIDKAPDGVTLLRELPEGAFDAMLLGIKPQMLGDLAPALEPLAGKGTTVLSILAGVELDSLAAVLPRADGHVRIMPNLSVAIGKSPVGLAAKGLDRAGMDAVTALIQPLGSPEWIEEGLFDLVTALVGSGPAFVFRFIEGLATGAAKLGLDPAQAQNLALAMVEGAASLALSSPSGPGELADRVASPGGTTRAGLDVLDADAAVVTLVEATLRAARDRSAEMAREARG
ncbi:MAG: pyrroline-5-carboxylate reductase [Sphingomonadaceae bacterium]|nr:pyrroline-5-carboxylate reductase [Sphingomonadaceae bacterium]